MMARYGFLYKSHIIAHALCCISIIRPLDRRRKTISEIMLSLFPKRQILDSSKLIGFADDNFKFEENGRKFSKWVENTVWEKENLIVTSNDVFKELVLQTRKNKG